MRQHKKLARKNDNKKESCRPGGKKFPPENRKQTLFSKWPNYDGYLLRINFPSKRSKNPTPWQLLQSHHHKSMQIVRIVKWILHYHKSSHFVSNHQKPLQIIKIKKTQQISTNFQNMWELMTNWHKPSQIFTNISREHHKL